MEDSGRAMFPSPSAALVLPFLGVLGGEHSSLNPALGQDQVRIFFAPRPGTRLTKSFDVELELVLRDPVEWSGYRDGEPLCTPMSGWFCGERVARSQERHVVLTDEYLALGQGRPLELRRTFDELDLDLFQGLAYAGQAACSRWGRSPLRNETVRFVWDDAREAFRSSFAAESLADTDLLEGLVEDTDLRGFLAPGPVEPGDSWTVCAANLGNLWRPGGALAFHAWDASDEELPFEHPLERALIANLEGQLTVEYRGLHGERDGGRHAQLVISGEIRSRARAVTPGPVSVGLFMISMPGTEVRSGALELRVEGTLLWDVENHHLHSLDLEAQVWKEEVLEQSTDDGTYTTETRFEWQGYLEIEVRVEC